MSTLYITDEFYEKLKESEIQKVLRLYGHKNADTFLKDIIDFLNKKYSFLKIANYAFMTKDEKSIYKMYNGFVKGDFDEYNEFLVSFSDLKTKEGNTIISQQLMPMLQNRISDNLNFLYDKKIKRVFLLTSHKTNTFDISKNSIKEDSNGSTLQLLVKCLLTLGFDVYPFIPILNLDTTRKFDNVKELIDNINYIREQNKGNLQHKSIDLIDDKIVGSFSQKPKGQDEKYFALRFLTAIYLNRHNHYDVSQAYAISDKSKMMEMLYLYSNYVETHDITYDFKKPLTDSEFLDLIKKEDEFLDKLKQLAEKYGEDGTRIVNTTVRLSEVQEELRNRLIKKHGCKCLLCNITNNDLLIASHIKPASACDIYGKADTENAFLLCAIHDRLFDRCLISFNFIDGKIMISNKLTADEIKLANLDPNYHLPSEMMTEKRVEYLMWHNEEFEKKNR